MFFVAYSIRLSFLLIALLVRGIAVMMLFNSSSSDTSSGADSPARTDRNLFQFEAVCPKRERERESN